MPEVENEQSQMSDVDKRRLRPIGLVLLILPFVAILALIWVWPLGPVMEEDPICVTERASAAVGSAAKSKDCLVVAKDAKAFVETKIEPKMHVELALLLVVLMSGALGSVIFAARSFAVHMGRQTFNVSWLWWYALRIPVGMGLALMIYLALRGGLFAGTFAEPEKVTASVNPFGFAAISALSGMFARQASEKLEEIFNNIFRTQGKPDGGETKSPPAKAPEITGFGAETLNLGATSATDLKLVVNGQNFDKKSEIYVNNVKKTTVYKSPTEIEGTLTTKDLEKAVHLSVVVVNPKDKGGASKPRKIEVK